MKAWVNHFALHLGSLIACIWYGILPPQWTGHTKEAIQELEQTDPISSFLEGLLG